MAQGGFIVTGPCYVCSTIFAFNTERVPSFMENGIRHPICLDCITLVNAERKQNGLPEWEIYPDSYGHIQETI